jgi:hypothetical protein
MIGLGRYDLSTWVDKGTSPNRAQSRKVPLPLLRLVENGGAIIGYLDSRAARTVVAHFITGVEKRGRSVRGDREHHARRR